MKKISKLNQSPDVVRKLYALHDAVEMLMDIVEGVRGKRWAAEGQRLVDTPEWCGLYTLQHSVNDASARAGYHIALDKN